MEDENHYREGEICQITAEANLGKRRRTVYALLGQSTDRMHTIVKLFSTKHLAVNELVATLTSLFFEERQIPLDTLIDKADILSLAGEADQKEIRATTEHRFWIEATTVAY